MKKSKVICCLIVSLVFSYQYSLEMSAKPQDIKTVNYCELFELEKYDGKVIHTTAILYIPQSVSGSIDGGDEFFYSGKCNNTDYFAIPDFSETEGKSLISKASKRLSNKNSPELFSITFTGKISVSLTPYYGHLGWSRAEIRVDKIESANLIKSKYALPDTESPAPILETGISLRTINVLLLFHFFGRESNSYRLDTPNLENLLPGDTKITFNGKLVKNTNFLELKDGELIVRTGEVNKNNFEWRVRGIVENKLENNKTKKLKYDNKFILQENNFWKLISSSIWEIP